MSSPDSLCGSDSVNFAGRIITSMKQQAEMIEGPEAFERFREAAKKMLSVPKSAVPNPFNKKARVTRPDVSRKRKVTG
jgi:hypothetical protein